MRTEEELIEKILGGEWRNFAILVEKYQAKVYSYVFYLMHTREDAEEVVQDTFMKAYRSLHQFRGDASFSTWLIRIAHHNCLSRFRRKVPDRVSLDNVYDDSFSGQETDPSQELDLNDRKKILARALERLKPEERSVVTMYYFNELSISEVSKVTDLSVSNVKVTLHRSRGKLLNILKEMGIKESTL
ncbi:MAG: RNA polymerase sigma factor [Cyclobacteriaceae bacterium]